MLSAFPHLLPEGRRLSVLQEEKGVSRRPLEGRQNRPLALLQSYALTWSAAYWPPLHLRSCWKAYTALNLGANDTWSIYLQAKKDLVVFKNKQQTFCTQCIDVTQPDERCITTEAPDTNDDDTTPSSEQLISATVGPKDVETTDRGSEMHTWSQWKSNRKWGMGSRMVTWPMTSRDLERSRSWPRYWKMQISRIRWEIEVRYQLTTNIGNGLWRIECTRDRWRHVTLVTMETSRSLPWYRKMQISWYTLDIVSQYQLTTNIGNGIWRIECTREWWRHVTLKAWPNYVWGLISRKRLEIHTWS